MDNSSLAYSKWNCKYHIVFAPKYRRQILYEQMGLKEYIDSFTSETVKRSNR